MKRLKEDQSINPGSNVRSMPMPSAGSVSWWQRIAWRKVPIAVVGLVFFGYLWLFGARYTIDGIPHMINFALAFLHAGFRVGTELNIYWYAGLFWIPVLYSYNEWNNPPIYRAPEGSWKIAPIGAIVVWLLVAATDFVSTLLGVQNPSADAWRLAKEIAGSIIIAGIWTGILTFGPEAGVRSMLRLMVKEG